MSYDPDEASDPADAQAEICYARHDDAPYEGCPVCDYRKTIQRCAYCDAEFVDGKWWNDRRQPNTPITGFNGCHHEPTDLMDDWWRTLHCRTMITVDHRRIQCPDDVAAPGLFDCTAHVVAAGYQAEVAAR